jgi:hypothetical protein
MSYATEVAADNPYLHWPLDETAGTTAVDSTLNGQDGTYAGGFTLDEEGAGGGLDQTGRAVELNNGGTNGEVASGALTGFPSTDFTIEFWLRIHTLNSNQMLVCYGNSVSTRAVGILHLSSQFGLYINGTGSILSLDLDNAENINVWHHIVVTWRNSDGRWQLYRDGNLTHEAIVGAAATITDGGALVVGQEWASTGSPPTGQAAGFDAKARFDEVAIYPTVLSGARIATHHAAGRAQHKMDTPKPSQQKLLGGSDVSVIPFPEHVVEQPGVGGGAAAPVDITQRLWDTNLGAWVQYTKTVIDTAPLPAETQPNHTGNTVASTHQVLGAEG